MKKKGKKAEEESSLGLVLPAILRKDRPIFTKEGMWLPGGGGLIPRMVVDAQGMVVSLAGKPVGEEDGQGLKEKGSIMVFEPVARTPIGHVGSVPVERVDYQFVGVGEKKKKK